MSAKSITRKITRIRATTSGEWRLLLEAALILTLVRLGLRLLSFQKVRGFLAHCRADARPAAAATSTPAVEVTRRVLWAVNAASRPVGTTCLPRALATHTLLARRGLASELRIGVTRSPGSPLEAHAWVENENGILIGNLPNLAQYKPFADLSGKGT